MLFNFMQRVHKMLPTVHNGSHESTTTTSPAVCCDNSVCSGRMLRAWRGRRLSWAWLVGVVQLLLALHRLVERLDEQSAARSGVPASSAHVDDQRLDDDLVQSGHWEREQQLHAEVLIVRCRRLHHLVAWILLAIHTQTLLHPPSPATATLCHTGTSSYSRSHTATSCLINTIPIY